MMKKMLSYWLLLVTLVAVGSVASSPAENATDLQNIKSFQLDKNFVNITDFIRVVRKAMLQEQQEKQSQQLRRLKRSMRRVCYGKLGCFEDQDLYDFREVLPSPPAEINTTFHFYSTKKKSVTPLLELPFLNMTKEFARIANLSYTGRRRAGSIIGRFVKGAAATPSSDIKSIPLTLKDLDGFDKLSVRVIVHGFGASCLNPWVYEMQTALMTVEDCIVICVDWTNGASFPNYFRAAANTRVVGVQLAQLLEKLQQHKGLNLTRTHIIGFSLGAHVSGFAGFQLPGLGRITGLDPAGPLFEGKHSRFRLDESDAEFVDVIHSNGDKLDYGGLGAWEPMGHVDFYPNGGREQTGCTSFFLSLLTDLIFGEEQSLCNHRRAYKLFIDSIVQNCILPAFPCASYDDFAKGKCFSCAQSDDDLDDSVPRCGVMGYYANRSSGRGQLYLTTREVAPYCGHQYKIEVFNSFDYMPFRTIGLLKATIEGDGGMNETFQISDDDDSQFYVGKIISKIIVPHPGFGFPTRFSLYYKLYSGWLAKGTQHWHIDKVVLTDTSARSYSICQPSIKLTSGIPVHLKLLAGKCQLKNEEHYRVN